MAKFLITGASGYVGKRLIPVLLAGGHDILCSVRDKARFVLPTEMWSRVQVVEVDLQNFDDYSQFPSDIDYAYYLVHSMTSSIDGFESIEVDIAKKFKRWSSNTSIKQIIFLSGLMGINSSSAHLRSRLKVEAILLDSDIPTTVLRAGIVVGSGSASFEIIRDLVEKLPIMITPKWVLSKTQPIAVRNVIEYLVGVYGKEASFNQVYDIGGPDIISYREMLLGYAEARGLKRIIWQVPVMTPRLSSYWLYFVTATSYFLAANLVNSMKVDVLCQNSTIDEICKPELISYKEAIRLAFAKVEQDLVTSSWKDAFNNVGVKGFINNHLQVPQRACFFNKQLYPIDDHQIERIQRNIWRIGGDHGWYYANFLWKIRGVFDMVFGGIGLRRGRTHKEEIYPGEALDFWRVLVADKQAKRLLLYAEMKMPGEAWLEFKLVKDSKGKSLSQIATFRPKGILGRLYWYLLTPFHFFIFRGMIREIVQAKN